MFFTRVAQIKDQLEAIGDMVEEAEVVMTTLNGLPEIGKPSFRNLFKEETNQIPEVMGRICPKRREDSSQRRKN